MSRRGVSRTRAIEEAERLSAHHVSREALRAQQAERRERAERLAAQQANVREVLELTRDLPRDASGVIYGPDGQPLLRPVIEDFTKTYADKGETDPVRFYAEDILKRAARMQRDGMSLDAIATELDIKGIVPLPMLDLALRRVGHPMLERDIAAGVEPQESKVVIGYDVVGADEDEVTAADTRIRAVRPITRREP